MSRPLTFLTAPVTSLIAITFPPASVISWAAQEPTLPNPWKRQARHLFFEPNKKNWTEARHLSFKR
jgi:hypothetical protein